MKKPIQIILFVSIVILTSAFVPKNETKLVATYGVSANNPSQITLQIFDNHTYYYQDFSIPNQKIVSRGQWQQSGNTITLHDENKQKNFHRVWKLSQDKKRAHSRKGLCFYSLCEM